MPEQYYDSPLSGQQLDAAFQQMQGIEQTASRVQSNASAAAQSASQAASSASAASSSATRAGQSATQAQNSASAASSSASAAAESARQAAGSAASIEGDADAAAQSASNAQGHATAAQGSASAAAASASAAKDSEDAAEESAGTAQSASAAAAQSERNAKTSETNAASSASAAQQAAALIEDNLAAIQAAPSNAQAAQNAAAQAASSATAAEDAAERAEQIADFNPADFATAAQGEKADTAVQPDELDAYALKTEVPTTPADIGAATAGQGAKADTALQPGALDGYAQTSDIPSKLPNPQGLTIRLGSGGSITTYDGSAAKSITVTPEAIGAQPAGESGGGSAAKYIVDTRLTSWASGAVYQSSGARGYDLLGIVCLCRGSTAADEYSQIQWFPVPESGQTRKYGLVCMNVADVGSSGPMGEAQTRVISITNNGSSIQLKSESAGYYYNWGNKGQDDTCAVPAFLYGITF